MSERIGWRYGAASDVGRVRRQNEDSYRADSPAGLFIVADGMGGHAAGEIASSLAVRCACEGAAALDPEGERDEASSTLESAISAANTAILREGRSRPERSGMGTTSTALYLSPEGWWVVAHVGDSRAYLVRDGEVSQITEDHTYVQELVNEGRISDEEARVHPRSSLLTRALGTTATVSVDVFEGGARPGDRFVLASDGLMSMVPEDTLRELIVRDLPPERLVDELIATANGAGGHDNITAIVVDVESEDRGPTQSED